jgi:hypothetical protein
VHVAPPDKHPELLPDEELLLLLVLAAVQLPLAQTALQVSAAWEQSVATLPLAHSQ